MDPLATLTLAKTSFQRSSGMISKWLRVCVILLICVRGLVAQDTSNQEVLTNEAIVELVKAKVGEGVIAGLIRTQPTKFSLGKDAMIKLKQQGVPDKVLAAMVAKGSSPAPASAAHAPQNQPLSNAERMASTAAVSRWEMRDQKDPMTGREFFDAHLMVRNDGQERIEATATCNISDSGPAWARVLGGTKIPPAEEIKFDLAYASKTGPGLARRAMAAEVERAPEVFGTTIGNDRVIGGGSCVFTRVRVGESVYSSVNSGGCAGKNVVSIAFSSGDLKASDALGGVTKSTGGGPRGQRVASAFSSLLPLVDAYAHAQLPSLGIFSLNDLLNANILLVELPLNDGTVNVVPLLTQDPSFRRFAARCAAEFARLAPVAPATAPPSPKPSPLQSLADRRYTGTVDGFATTLPGLIHRAASAMGLDTKNYDKEADFIVGAVRTCSEITPQMYASLAGRAARPDLSKFGEQYRICNGNMIPVSEQVKRSNQAMERGIELTMVGVGSYGRTESRGFGAVVSFSPMKGDSFRSVAFENYGIVSASIYSSASDVKQPLTATSLQKLSNRRFEGTADGFASAFPGFLQRAAAAMSLDPKNYEGEAAFVIAAVRTCGQITPKMAESTDRQYPNGRYMGTPNIRKLGEQYAVCFPAGLHNISDELKISHNEPERSLLIWMFPPLGNWEAGQEFTVQVYFGNLKNESLVPESHFNTLGIVDAKVR